jgi:ornithine cyclodeaminase
VTVRILSEADVRRLLPMEECIERMAEVLAALARGELYQPLRPLFVPPAAASFMGLMPAYRAEPEPVWALKAICLAPGNPARGLDAHQGFVALYDGVTGEVRAIANASPITEIRTAAVSAVATRLLARPGSRTLAILGAGVQARSHLEALRAVLPIVRVRGWSRTPG